MIKIQAYIPEDLYTLAKVTAKNQKVNFSELLRLSLQNYIDSIKKKRKLKTIKIPNIGATNAALTHNDIYER